MPAFRYPDGSWPRPIKEVAAAICCIDGTTSANQAEHIYHASGHYYGGLHENVKNPLRCRLVPCSWLASCVEELANHVSGHEEFNLLNNDESFDRLYALLRAAQPQPRPSPGFRLGEPTSVSQRPRPSPQARQSSRPSPSPRPGSLRRTDPSLRRRTQSLRLPLPLLQARPQNPGAPVSPRLGARLAPSPSRLPSPAPPSPLSPPAPPPALPSAQPLLPLPTPPPVALPPSVPSPHPLLTPPQAELAALGHLPSYPPTLRPPSPSPRPLSPAPASPPAPLTIQPLTPSPSPPLPPPPSPSLAPSPAPSPTPSPSVLAPAKRYRDFSPEIGVPVVGAPKLPFCPIIRPITNRLPPKKRFRGDGSMAVRSIQTANKSKVTGVADENRTPPRQPHLIPTAASAWWWNLKLE